MMNVVIYARYSSAKQNETSIEAQLKECHNYCKQNNYLVVGEYIDRATSARTDDRPDFQRMILDSNKKLFEGIVVYQLDRFSRSREDSAHYKHKLKKNGVKVYSAKEPIGEGPSGILVESLLEGMAEYYSAELGQKVTRNMRQNAEKGFFNGGYAPLGYKVITINMGTYEKKRLEIDPEVAPIIQQIFEMRANNVKIRDIIETLNSKGLKNYKGKEFENHSLQTLLKNERYTGTNFYGEEAFPNTIPAIISKELFDRVQEVSKSYKHRPAKAKASEEYLLTGKLFCGKCKEGMVGISGTSKTGKIYHYYICNGVRSRKCDKKNISKSYIEEMVVNKCRELLTAPNINKIANKVYEINKNNNSQNAIVQSLNKRIKQLNKNIENLLVAIESGENVDLFNDKITLNRKELNEAQKQLVIEESKNINLSKAKIKFFLSQLKDGSINEIQHKKTLINIFINQIYLFDDKLVITFNVGSENVTINTTLINNIASDLKKDNSLYFNKLGSP